MSAPLLSFTVHVCVLWLHHLPVLQSPSTLQPPLAMHAPFELHTPERQRVSALPVQVPSELAQPHLLSVSHTALAHTSVAAAEEQVPLSVGFV